MGLRGVLFLCLALACRRAAVRSDPADARKQPPKRLHGIVVSGQERILGLTVVGSFLYWVSGERRLQRAHKHDGGVETLFFGKSVYPPIVVLGARVFVGADGGVTRVAPALKCPIHATSFAGERSHLFFETDRWMTSIPADGDGCAPSKHFETATRVESLAVTSRHLVWIEDGDIRYAPRSGPAAVGAPTTLTKGYFERLLVDGEDVVAIENDYPTLRLARVSLLDGERFDLDEDDHPKDVYGETLALDSTRVFWNPSARIRVVPRSGGRSVELANYQYYPSLAADDEAFYWSTPDGQILANDK